MLLRSEVPANTENKKMSLSGGACQTAEKPA